jgi:hypothetical protein
LRAALFKTEHPRAGLARRIEPWRDPFDTRQRESPMLIKFFFTCTMVFALLTLSFPAGRGLQFVALAAACAAAALAAVRSIDEDRYLWFSGFIAIAVLLNPIGALWLTRTLSLVMLGICLTMVASWMIMRRRAVRSLSIAQVLHPRDLP